MSIASFFTGISSKIKAGLARVAQMVGISEALQVADQVTASMAPPPQVYIPSTRRRKAGPVRPAGSKLARKAAKGTVGKATLR